MTNNPAALALHEAKLLWPGSPFQCIVSLGTGRYKGRSGPSTTSFSTVREKLLKIVASATDTEGKHIEACRITDIGGIEEGSS